MAFSLEQILGFVPLTAAVERVKSGVPRKLPPEFYKRNPGDQVLGNKARLIQYVGTRKNARIAPYGSPPRQIVQLPRESLDVILLHTIENLPLTQELFLQLRELDSYVVQKMAADEIAYQATGAMTRQTNLESSSIHVMLANGSLWFDSDNNLLATSTGAALTIDYGVPANNKNQLNGTISASWVSPSTNIPLHIQNVKQAGINLTGYPITKALYGRNVMGYLLGNSLVQQYMKYNTPQAEFWLKSGQIPPGLFGLEWIPMQDTFFEDINGNVTEIFGHDQVTFTPDITPMTYGIYEGSYPVPKTLMIAQDVEAMLGNYEVKYGPFGFCMMNPPAQIIGVYGDTFLPRLKVPSAFFFATVAF